MRRRLFLSGISGAGLAGVAVSARADAGLTVPRPATPDDGFFVPAEDHPHEACLMQWPASRDVYPDPAFLSHLQRTIARLAAAISDFEPVIMLAAASQHRRARRLLPDRVELWDIPTEDLWCRDSGPIIAIDGAGRRAVRHIRFNGWGGRQRHHRDGRIAKEMAALLDLPLLPTPLVGEAGGVEQDGHGLLIAHESSWVHENRNPGLDRDAVEAALLSAYGADRMIWAPGLKDQDITDFHIDALARFTAAGRVLMTLPKTPDPYDPFHRAAALTHAALMQAGLTPEIIPEPVRRRVSHPEFVASYVNFYVANGAVIAAGFGDPETDEIANSALARHYPGRQIVMINADAIGEVGGGIHCATHEIPAA